jgi:hypothetical protein
MILLLIKSIIHAFCKKIYRMLSNDWRRPSISALRSLIVCRHAPMNIIYGTANERGTTILMPTSMVDSMNPAAALSPAGQAPALNSVA